MFSLNKIIDTFKKKCPKCNDVGWFYCTGGKLVTIQDEYCLADDFCVPITGQVQHIHTCSNCEQY